MPMVLYTGKSVILRIIFSGQNRVVIKAKIYNILYSVSILHDNSVRVPLDPGTKLLKAYQHEMAMRV